MSDRTYLGDTGVYGTKIDSGPGVNIAYMDGRTVASDENVDAARKKWIEANPDDFQVLDDGRFVDKGSGALYRRAPGQPLLADSSNVSLFFVVDDSDGGSVVCLEKAGGTLQELEQETARAEAEQASAETSAAEQRRKRLDRLPRPVVTLGDLERRDLPSLQRAARIVVEEFRGTVRARDGRLEVEVPEGPLTEPGAWDAGTNEALERQRVADATRVLICARDLVLQELDRRGRLDPARLPDVQVTADGTVQ